MLIGAIEAGGTKMICAIGNSDGQILESISFPTTYPGQTIPHIVSFFKQHAIEGLGIGTFGPVCLDATSEQYGQILATPKKAWEGFNWVSTLKAQLNIPIYIDTDVNGAALAEIMWGAAKGLKSCVYITIGTGIGMGIYHNGDLIHGLLHPEGGHMLLSRHPLDHFKGVCPFHTDCFEGLASGPSLEARFGMKAHLLPSDHLAWEIESYYIAQGILNSIMLLSPEKIILGGGVMHQLHLFPLIYKHLKKLINNYISLPELEAMSSYIVQPGIPDISGTYGALAIFIKAHTN